MQEGAKEYWIAHSSTLIVTVQEWVDEIWKWGRVERREQDGAQKLGKTGSVGSSLCIVVLL